MDQNNEIMAQQTASADNVKVHVDPFWVALHMEAQSPEKSTNVRDVKVSDKDGFSLS